MPAASRANRFSDITEFCVPAFPAYVPEAGGPWRYGFIWTEPDGTRMWFDARTDGPTPPTREQWDALARAAVERLQ